MECFKNELQHQSWKENHPLRLFVVVVFHPSFMKLGAIFFFAIIYMEPWSHKAVLGEWKPYDIQSQPGQTAGTILDM